jgi:hypothetical protein
VVVGFIDGGKKLEDPEKTTDLSPVTDKLYHNSWQVFFLEMSPFSILNIYNLI